MHKLMACIFLAASLAFFNSSLQVCHSSLCEMTGSFLCLLPWVFCSRDCLFFGNVTLSYPKGTLQRGNARGVVSFLLPALTVSTYLVIFWQSHLSQRGGDRSTSRDFTGFSKVYLQIGSSGGLNGQLKVLTSCCRTRDLVVEKIRIWLILF